MLPPAPKLKFRLPSNTVTLHRRLPDVQNMEHGVLKMQRSSKSTVNEVIHSHSRLQSADTSASIAQSLSIPVTPIVTTTSSTSSVSLRVFLRAVLAIGASLGLGDVISQLLEQQSISNFALQRTPGLNSININFERSATMFFIGAAVTGPLSQTFQILLERRIPGNTLFNVVAKVFCASVWAVTTSLPILFTATTLLQKDYRGKRGTLKQAKEKISKDLVPTFLAGLMYWPFINLMLFRFVAMSNRALGTSCAGTLWNTYLSSVANRGNTKEANSLLTNPQLVESKG